MNFLRSALFLLVASLITVATAPFVIFTALVFGPRPGYWIVHRWRRLFMACVRHILGIRAEIRGLENMPREACVILSKHQSAWETVALQDMVPRGAGCVFVLKKELLMLPFFGWSLAAMRMISIDRKAGKDALDQVVHQGRERLDQGYYVIVFPEGTRTAPGESRRYKAGGAYLATRAARKVVPVAHDAGELWPKNAFIKRPGTLHVSIGPAIDPAGLSEQELNAQAQAWIEDEMRRIAPHRYATPPA